MSMARHTLDVEYVSMWACRRVTEVALDVEYVSVSSLVESDYDVSTTVRCAKHPSMYCEGLKDIMS